MIYIDPPYNTGHDFIYKDKFRMDEEDYAAQTELFDEEGNKQFAENNDSNPRFHSDWCSMMYARLLLARNLLTDNGVIFISIDDNEFANLRKICDEILGEDSFKACGVWKRRTSSAMDQSKISTDHEYILIYVKKSFRNFKGIEKSYSEYSNPDNDPRGPWVLGDLTVGMNADMRPNQYYDLVDPDTGKIYHPNFNRVWAYIPESMQKLIDDKRIVFPKDTTQRPMKKRFAKELKSNTNPFSTWMTDVGLNTAGTKAIYQLFDNKVLFNYAKPINLVKFLMEQVLLKNDIVLDFFSGSATTAHAVMELNAEDGGHRKFIMVQLPEACDAKSEAYKAGYRTICDIGEERIRRAGEKIRQEHPGAELDTGFRVFRVDSTNMEDVYYSAGDYSQAFLAGLVSNVKPDRSALDLFFGCILDAGLPLDRPYAAERIEGCTVHDYGGGLLLACFDEAVPEAVIRAMAARHPLHAVFRDSSFADSAARINADEIFKSASTGGSHKGTAIHIL